VFESPAGEEHIAVGKDGEGYGICDVSGDHNQYFDYAEFGNSGNWGPATVLSQSATSVKISRNTSDGVWTLTQTFTRVSGASPSVKIAMALKNNSALDRTVFLMRYVNVDAAGVFQNNLDATTNSAFGWNSIGANSPFGLVLQNVGESPFNFSGFVQNVPDGPAPCSTTLHQVPGPLTGTDGSVFMFYAGTVPKWVSRTATVSYKGF